MDNLAFDELIAMIAEQEELIDELMDLADEGRDVRDDVLTRIEDTRDWAARLIDDIDDMDFFISDDPDDRGEQQMLLQEIQAIGKKIHQFRFYPDITTHLRLQRGALLVALANTYNDLTAYVIEFSEDEVMQLRLLLRRAVLDAEERQHWANVLDSAVQLSKFMFRVGTRMAT